MYSRLLQLPLFQGISHREFQEIAQTISLSHRRVSREITIVTQDEACTELHFILSGETRITRESNDHSYALTEWRNQPMVVEPDALFGLTTRYTRTYTVARSTELLTVDKAAVRDILFNYPTFRINYLNFISAHTQLATRQLWHTLSPTPAARFAQFIEARSLRPAGRKQLRIMRRRLAIELNDTALVTAHMLSELRDKGLLELTRGYIIIPNFEKLLLAVRK